MTRKELEPAARRELFKGEAIEKGFRAEVETK